MIYKQVDFNNNEGLPVLTFYKAKKKTSEWTILIFPGGGYEKHSKYEGEEYAHFLNKNGFDAFVLNYRIYPDLFPAPLLDARRAIQYIRHNKEKFELNHNKIAVMGSSAGGHLAALVSNYKEHINDGINDEISNEDYLPNAQILCYPVIRLTSDFTHVGSQINLLGKENLSMAQKLSVDSLVTDKTPPAFIWHTFSDNIVSVLNSLSYATELKKYAVRTEIHIFPDGGHGLGLANDDETDPVLSHISQWSDLLVNWLKYL